MPRPVGVAEVEESEEPSSGEAAEAGERSGADHGSITNRVTVPHGQARPHEVPGLAGSEEARARRTQVRSLRCHHDCGNAASTEPALKQLEDRESCRNGPESRVGPHPGDSRAVAGEHLGVTGLGVGAVVGHLDAHQGTGPHQGRQSRQPTGLQQFIEPFPPYPVPGHEDGAANRRRNRRIEGRSGYERAQAEEYRDGCRTHGTQAYTHPRSRVHEAKEGSGRLRPLTRTTPPGGPPARAAHAPGRRASAFPPRFPSTGPRA